MSNVPTSVRAVIDVDLLRPRGLSDLQGSDRANAIRKQARVLNRAGYAIMGPSMLLFIIAGLRS